MSDITSQVASSTDLLMQELDIIAHNLANVSTTGFKRQCHAFAKSLVGQPLGEEVPAEVDLNSVLDFSQGSIVETARPLDLALYGKGFFTIETPQGPLYTRNGAFSTNANGQIVDMAGRIVAGQSGPMTIPAGASLSQLVVSGDGTVHAGNATVGTFQIVDFGDDENKLIPAGLNCFLMPDENVTPLATEKIVVKQGYQEASNVSMVQELVDMIMVSRLYEANMKFLTAQKETGGSLLSVAMA